MGVNSARLFSPVLNRGLPMPKRICCADSHVYVDCTPCTRLSCSVQVPWEHHRHCGLVHSCTTGNTKPFPGEDDTGDASMIREVETGKMEEGHGQPGTARAEQTQEAGKERAEMREGVG